MKYKRLLRKLNYIVIPLIFSRIFSFLFMFVDQWIGVNISRESYIAISISEEFSYVIIGIFGSLVIPLNILGSKYVKTDKQKYSEVFLTSFHCVNIIGGVLVLTSFIFSKLIFKNVFNLKGEVLNLSVNYFNIISIGVWLTLCLFVFSSFFKTQEKSHIIFYGSLINNIINIIFSCYFVFVLKLGVIGAALGTALGICSNIVLEVFYFSKISFFKLRFFFNKKIGKEIIKKYIPIFIQDFLEDGLPMVVLISILSSKSNYLLGDYNFSKTFFRILILSVYPYATISMNLVVKSKKIKSKKLIPIFASVSSLFIFTFFVIILIVFKKYFFILYSSESWVIETINKIIKLNILILVPVIFSEIYKFALNGIGKEKNIMILLLLEKSLFLVVIYFFENLSLEKLLLVIGLFNFLMATICMGLYYYLLKKGK